MFSPLDFKFNPAKSGSNGLYGLTYNVCGIFGRLVEHLFQLDLMRNPALLAGQHRHGQHAKTGFNALDYDRRQGVRRSSVA